MKDYQIVGPDWLRSEGFDVVATFPATTTRGGLQQMLQALLAERSSWVPDDASDSADGQSLNSELHRLGLKLEPRKRQSIF